MNIFRIFQKNFKKLLLLALMIVLPIYVIQEFLIIPSLPDDLETGDLRMIWYTLSIWLISLFLYVFRISVIKLSYDSLEEKDTGISELMDFSVRLWPKVLLTTLLYALSVACGLMLFFFPGLILFVAYAFYQYISVKTGLSQTQEGIALSIADKLDSIAGFFAIGIKPLCSKTSSFRYIKYITRQKTRYKLRKISRRCS